MPIVTLAAGSSSFVVDVCEQIGGVVDYKTTCAG